MRPRALRLSANKAFVSIHAPAWGATLGPRLGLGQLYFVSIHAPAWGATWEGVNSFRQREVSIHAPAWGATQEQLDLFKDTYVSIHAPAWGATL